MMHSFYKRWTTGNDKEGVVMQFILLSIACMTFSYHATLLFFTFFISVLGKCTWCLASNLIMYCLQLLQLLCHCYSCEPHPTMNMTCLYSSCWDSSFLCYYWWSARRWWGWWWQECRETIFYASQVAYAFISLKILILICSDSCTNRNHVHIQHMLTRYYLHTCRKP